MASRIEESWNKPRPDRKEADILNQWKNKDNFENDKVLNWLSQDFDAFPATLNAY